MNRNTKPQGDDMVSILNWINQFTFKEQLEIAQETLTRGYPMTTKEATAAAILNGMQSHLPQLTEGGSAVKVFQIASEDTFAVIICQKTPKGGTFAAAGLKLPTGSHIGQAVIIAQMYARMRHAQNPEINCCEMRMTDGLYDRKN